MKNFLRKTAIKMQQFMTGRYGIDQLYRALLWFYLAVMLIGAILARTVDIRIYTAVMLLSLLIIIYAFFRVFSKNIEKRRKENTYFQKMPAMQSRFKAQKNQRQSQCNLPALQKAI